MKDKKIIFCIIFLAIIVIVLWKVVYKNGYKKKAGKDESGYLYLDGTWYVNQPWHDSWPNW